MAIDAETLFSGLGASYEAAFASNPTLRKFAQTIAQTIRPNGRILDMGCGTGKPVAETLAAAGHDVHGIDISAEMARIAQSQVKGRFEVADMKNFQPLKPYDGVCAILSLFQLTPGEIHAMVFRFAEWVRVGGYVAIGVTPSTGLSSEDCTYDPTWDCVWVMDKLWMGNRTNEVFFSEGGWTRLLRSAGFVIEMEPVDDLFCPSGPMYTAPEVHYYVLARKVEEQPLLGPYPIPMSLPTAKASSINISPINPFTDRLISKDLESFLHRLTEERDMLVLRDEDSLGRFISHNDEHVQYHSGRLDTTLPYKSNSFQTILVPWILDQRIDIATIIQNLVRIANPHNSQIIILQGAPSNETIIHLNAVARSPQIPHQGQLLRDAAEHLEKQGFGDIVFRRVQAHYEFSEGDLSVRCALAAKSLVDIWYKGHPHYTVIRDALVSRLRLHFRGQVHGIGNDMVVLVAKSSGEISGKKMGEFIE